MPTYVYRGLKSGETFEVRQRITDAALTSNPTTGEPVARVIQAPGIVFKGSGFYVTDSRKGSAGEGRSSTASIPSPASKPASSETSTPSESSATAKPNATAKPSAE